MRRVHGDWENWRTERWRTQERIKIPRGGVSNISYQHQRFKMLPRFIVFTLIISYLKQEETNPKSLHQRVHSAYLTSISNKSLGGFLNTRNPVNDRSRT